MTYPYIYERDVNDCYEQYEDGYIHISNGHLYIALGGMQDESYAPALVDMRVVPHTLHKALAYLETIRTQGAKALATQLGFAVHGEKCVDCNEHATRRNGELWHCDNHRTDTRYYATSLYSMTLGGMITAYTDGKWRYHYLGIEYVDIEAAKESVKDSSSIGAILLKRGLSKPEVVCFYLAGKFYVDSDDCLPF